MIPSVTPFPFSVAEATSTIEPRLKSIWLAVIVPIVKSPAASLRRSKTAVAPFTVIIAALCVGRDDVCLKFPPTVNVPPVRFKNPLATPKVPAKVPISTSPKTVNVPLLMSKVPTARVFAFVPVLPGVEPDMVPRRMVLASRLCDRPAPRVTVESEPPSKPLAVAFNPTVRLLKLPFNVPLAALRTDA